MIRPAPWQKELTIHGRLLTFEELQTFSLEKIADAASFSWEKEIYSFLLNWSDHRDYIVQHSSGSTGVSKEIRLHKQLMMDSAMATCNFFSLKKNETSLLCLPISYIAGKMMIVRSLAGALNLYLAEPKSEPDLNEIPAIDFCAMVPLQVSSLLNSGNKLQTIKKLIIGGSGIGPELEYQLRKVPTEVYATFGMAETSSHVALRRLNGTDPQNAFTALPGVTLSQDERNCLVISATWLPHRVITNDLIRFTGTDSFIWLGRLDNLINSGGIKIVPEEVENVVMEKTGLTCTVVGLPDQTLGEKLVFVFEKEIIQSVSQTLKNNLSASLPRYWKPKEIVVVDQFPRNASMKIDRIKLIEMISCR